jgi:hypothetical protein
MLKRYIIFVGRILYSMARITGIVKEVTTPKSGVTVFIYERETGGLIDSTVSAVDGTFSFNNLDNTKRYTVTALSDNENFNDGIDDNLETVSDCDAHFSDVLLLLNGQTTITTDASSHNRTLLTSGTPTLDISTPLFGYPTYKIDYNVTEYVGISSDAFVASAFTNNEWCIEIWVRPTQTGAQYNFSYISQIILGWLGTGNFRATCTNIGGTSTTITTSSNLYTANTWYHIAYVRDNTDSVFSYLKLYVNGIHVATSTGQNKSAVIGTGATFGRLIGYNNNGAAGNFTNLRITNNTARYYSNFSVPTEAFPTEQC